jgi:hypothetical protein
MRYIFDLSICLIYAQYMLNLVHILTMVAFYLELICFASSTTTKRITIHREHRGRSS